MKEEMCRLYELTDYKQAHEGWTKWFDAAKESGIPALGKFATQKECRIPGLAAHAKFQISTGKLEGFNNKIKVANVSVMVTVMMSSSLLSFAIYPFHPSDLHPTEFREEPCFWRTTLEQAQEKS